jgi:hypothetical protein
LPALLLGGCSGARLGTGLLCGLRGCCRRGVSRPGVLLRRLRLRCSRAEWCRPLLLLRWCC